MTALVLRLAAPWQSWGTSSRFVRRNTDRAPSKSGVVGLLAAAQGRRRTDPIEDLIGLRIGVRIDQPGHIERDFQTARPTDGSQAMPLSYRFYLADAVFLVAVEGDANMLAGLQEAIRRPAYPLFLGRRSCPPAGRVEHGVRETDVAGVLTHEPWFASKGVQESLSEPDVGLDVISDQPIDGSDARREVVQDDPISFDPERREHGWRTVYRQQVRIPNPHYRTRPATMVGAHDPMAALDGLD
ncbi:MAG TPA: type I-E CRISPR-associated protein Cas5/CasD [Pseudonocardiaceae bacterium]|nr:type I-E CRISPR-associated protein Cas5/CasD [Pseudonocardiaceae bacterium]